MTGARPTSLTYNCYHSRMKRLKRENVAKSVIFTRKLKIYSLLELLFSAAELKRIWNQEHEHFHINYQNTVPVAQYGSICPFYVAVKSGKGSSVREKLERKYLLFI